MANEKQQKQNENSKAVLAVLGIVFLFIPGTSFLGIILIIVCILSSSNKNGDIMSEIKKDLKDIEYEIKDEEVTEEEENMYKQIEEQAKANPIDADMKQESMQQKKELTFNGGAIDNKGSNTKNNGPIKYY